MITWVLSVYFSQTQTIFNCLEAVWCYCCFILFLLQVVSTFFIFKEISKIYLYTWDCEKVWPHMCPPTRKRYSRRCFAPQLHSNVCGRTCIYQCLSITHIRVYIHTYCMLQHVHSHCAGAPSWMALRQKRLCGSDKEIDCCPTCRTIDKKWLTKTSNNKV